MSSQRWRAALPAILMGVGLLAAWELTVRRFEIPSYIVPGPVAIGKALVVDWPLLSGSLLATLRLTLFALLFATVGGLLAAIVFSESRFIERTLFPYAVILQVTPSVAIAPLIIIWVNNTAAALVLCATFVAFFPILSATVAGLKSADHNLTELFELHRARRWQTLLYLKLPAALPYFLSGLRISGGLALVGAVVAEFVAGSGGHGSGLAYRILDAGYQLQFPRLFAALVLISVIGVAMHFLTSFISYLCLRSWHESTLVRER